MREIELKFQVDNFDEIIKILDYNKCKISKFQYQSDTIFIENLNKTESIEGTIWLRVRKIDDKCEMNVKKQSSKKSESQEIEFVVEDYNKACDFLKVLGYKEWVKVNKKRRYTKYMNANICLDEVEQLGSFVEIEIIVPDDDIKDNYDNDLEKIAINLGIDSKNIVNSHYDTMIHNLKG